MKQSILTWYLKDNYGDSDEAISVNLAYKSEDYFNEIMINRETKVLQMIKDALCD